jgi:hypothetical protein
MPVLYFPLCVSSGEDVPGFEVVVLGPPKDVGEGGLGLIADGIGEALLLDVEDLDRSILAG